MTIITVITYEPKENNSFTKQYSSTLFNHTNNSKFKKYSRNERVILRDLNHKDSLNNGSSKTKKTKTKKNKIQLKKSKFYFRP